MYKLNMRKEEHLNVTSAIKDSHIKELLIDTSIILTYTKMIKREKAKKSLIYEKMYSY
jgi:hypothetical protein